MYTIMVKEEWLYDIQISPLICRLKHYYVDILPTKAEMNIESESAVYKTSQLKYYWTIGGDKV
jgi:hypothetical protein